MDKQEMLTKIYEVIADKTLSFGCIVEKRKSPYTDLDRRRIAATAPRDTYDGDDSDDGDSENTGNIDILCPYFTGSGSMQRKACSTDIEKIKGHPVMIGDVLDWMIKTHQPDWTMRVGLSQHEQDFGISIDILMFNWDKKRDPIDTQSDYCIKYVYDLLPPQS